jgi:hypothetical protein
VTGDAYVRAYLCLYLALQTLAAVSRTGYTQSLVGPIKVSYTMAVVP